MTKLKEYLSRTLQRTFTDSEIQRACHCVNRCCKVGKYRSFQYRIIHNAIFLGNRLAKMNIVQSNKCFLCGTEVENVIHLFWECTKTKKLLHEIVKYVEEKYTVNLNFNVREVITGIWSNTETCTLMFQTLIVVVFKQMIYATKCLKQNVTSSQIIDEIEFIHEIEHREATRSGRVVKYNNKEASWLHAELLFVLVSIGFPEHHMSMWKPCGIHVETMWRPCGNHVVSVWKLCSIHI